MKISIIFMLLIALYGCRSTKESIDNDIHSKQSSLKNMERKTITNEIGETVTKIIETDYKIIISPKDGKIESMPIHQKETQTIHKREKNTIDSNIVSESENKAIDAKTKKTSTSKSDVVTIKETFIIGLIIALIVLMLRYKTNILSSLKRMTLFFKSLFK